MSGETSILGMVFVGYNISNIITIALITLSLMCYASYGYLVRMKDERDHRKDPRQRNKEIAENEEDHS